MAIPCKSPWRKLGEVRGQCSSSPSPVPGPTPQATRAVAGVGAQFSTLHDNTAKLADGIAQIEAGDAKLAAGVSSGGGQLTDGFNQLINRLNLGLGSTVSVLLFVIVVLVSALFIKGFGVKVEEGRPGG